LSQVIDSIGDKVLCLSEQQLVRLLEDNVCRLLHSCPLQQVPVTEFLRAYTKICSGCLFLEDFGVRTVDDLIAKIPHLAKVCLGTTVFRGKFFQIPRASLPNSAAQRGKFATYSN